MLPGFFFFDTLPFSKYNERVIKAEVVMRKLIFIAVLVSVFPILSQNFQTGSATISDSSPGAQVSTGGFSFEFRADNIRDTATPSGSVKTMSNILVKVDGSFLANVEATTRSGTVVRHVKDKKAIALQITNVDTIRINGNPYLRGASFSIVVNPY